MIFPEHGREWGLPGLFYADGLVVCGELLEKDLRAMVGWFVEVCRRGLKVNAGKSKMMVMNGEEGLDCEVHVDGVCLEHASKFKYLGCVLNKSGTDRAECSGRVASACRPLVSARDLQIEYSRVLHETLLVPVLTYGSESLL